MWVTFATLFHVRCISGLSGVWLPDDLRWAFLLLLLLFALDFIRVRSINFSVFWRRWCQGSMIFWTLLLLPVSSCNISRTLVPSIKDHELQTACLWRERLDEDEVNKPSKKEAESVKQSVKSLLDVMQSVFIAVCTQEPRNDSLTREMI